MPGARIHGHAELICKASGMMMVNLVQIFLATRWALRSVL